MYDKLFSKCKINGCVLRNRVIMSPMDDCLGQASGEMTARGVEYYAAKAKGGTGLVIVGFVGVIGPEYGGVSMSGQTFLRTLDDRHAMNILADRIREFGGKVFVQLNHPGRKSSPKFNEGHIPMSASAITPQLEARGFAPCREMTKDDIQLIEDAFANAAEHAYYAGCDGVELHCAHWFMFHQFISPTRNCRTDEYGGSLENRCRIVTETIAKIRSKVPATFPVTVRVHLFDNEGMEGEPGLEDWVAVCKHLQSHGVDAFHFSVGVEERTGAPDMPFGWRNEYLKRFKQELNVPVYGPNETKTPDEAESLLEDDICDFVVMGRQHSADPEWCNKAKSGHPEDIRPCISCNWCVYRVTADQAQVRCAVNPLLGREVDNMLPMKKGEGTVIVIGTGPAGIQSALTLTERGFKVKLYDKRTELCGSLNLANEAPNKFRMDNIIRYYKHVVEKNENIELHLGTEVTPEMLDEFKALDPYAVILACGGKPIVPGKIPGIEKGVACFDVLTGKVKFSGKHVAVVGGGMTGLETAERLAEDGNKVTLIEMMPLVGNGIYFYNVRRTRRQLESKGAVIKTSTALQEVKDDCIVVAPANANYIGSGLDGIKNIAGVADAVVEDEHDGPYEIPVDAAVLSLGIRPDLSLLDEIESRFERVVHVGDCTNPGRIGDATGAAFLAVKKI